MTYRECDCCEYTAGVRVKTRVHGETHYRFACKKLQHQAAAERVMMRDVGRIDEVLFNPTGFDAKTGRMLGPPR